IPDVAAVVPVEARELEWLAVELLDLGKLGADANAVDRGPGRLVLDQDRGPAARLLVAPVDLDPGLGVVRIDHAGLDRLSVHALDVAIDHVVAAERFYQVGMAGIAPKRPLALEPPRGRGTLGPSERACKGACKRARSGKQSRRQNRR